MKYMIHSYPDRMWYVTGYLIPSLEEQGIDESDIIVWNDENKTGNLKAWIASLEDITEPTWHLQDDVVISKTFRDRSLIDYNADVVCGFVSRFDDFPNAAEFDTITPDRMWYSFQCIKYGPELVPDFLQWYEDFGRHDFWGAVQDNKGDDLFFKEFLKSKHPKYSIKCIMPCMVQHIDYLMGGSIINEELRKESPRALFWEEHDVVEGAKTWIFHNK